MRYSVDWQDDAENAALEERETVADLRIWLNENNVTLHLIDGVSVDHLTISLYGLAEGLVHDWWNLFGGRDEEVSLVKHRSGYLIPDIRLSFDGSIFEISAHQRIYRNPEARFWVGPAEVMTRAQAEGQLDKFVDDVLSRLRERNVAGTSAELRWARVRASRMDADEAAFCEAAGALGLDPYQIDEQSAALIENAAAHFQGEPLTEFLAGGGRADKRKLLEWVERVDGRAEDDSLLSQLRSVAEQTASQAPVSETAESWALGYRRAKALRRVLNLGSVDRIRSYRKLAEMVGAAKSYELAPRIDGLRAMRSDHESGIHIHLRDHGTSQYAESGHLFSFARAVGDAACFPEPGKAPVNELHFAYRQAAGRAFAAELLAPICEIRAMFEDGYDTVSVAEEFGVATNVVERQWENRSRIENAIP